MLRFLLIASFVLFSFKNYSQCCASGCCSPGTANFGVLEKGHLMAFSFYKHNYSDQFYKGDAPYDLKYYRNIFFDFTGINLSYGITSRLTVQGDIGYFINKTQNYYPIGGRTLPSLIGNGLGDAGLYFKYNFYNNDVWNFTIGAGGKIPTGQFNQYIYGVRLPLEVQSGTGAYAGTVMLNVMIRPFKNKAVNFVLNSRTDYNGISPVGYQFGIANTNTLAYTFVIYKKLSFMAMMRNEIKGVDYTYNALQANPEPETRYNPFTSNGFSNQLVQTNTGSFKFFACPGLTCGLGKDWNISAYGDIPIYQYFTGIQFAAKYAFSIAISKMFELHKHGEHEEIK